MMPERVALITGATGFVGGNVAHYLAREGWVVEAIVRPTSDIPFALSTPNAVGTNVYDGTIDSMRSIMQQVRPDVVFHLASLFISDHSPDDIAPLIQSNLMFGAQLVEAMTLTEISCLVNTGTSWQHYERASYNPVNLYAATKQAFESLLQYYVEARALRVTTLKLFDTYGPHDPRAKLLNLLRRAATTRVPLEMSPGEQQIDLVHVSDVARAYLIAAERLLGIRGPVHEKYAVSSGHPISLKALVEKLDELWGMPLSIDWGSRGYRRREVMETWRGATLPGWRPLISLADGIKEMTPGA